MPGETPLDLSRHGILPADLFFGENIKKLQPYELYEWWYQREFPTPAGIAGRRLELRFRWRRLPRHVLAERQAAGGIAGLDD